MSSSSYSLSKITNVSEDVFQVIPGGSQETQIITLHLGKQCFGVPIIQVQDIVIPQNMTFVPQAPNMVRGVLNLRGRIVTVLDLKVVFGHKAIASIKNSISFSIEYENDLYTLLVDRVGEVLRVPKENILNVPKNLDKRLSHIATGILQLKRGLVIVIDIPLLMRFIFQKEEPQQRPDVRWSELMQI